MSVAGFHPGPLAYFEDMTPDFVARAGGYLVTEAKSPEFGRRFDQTFPHRPHRRQRFRVQAVGPPRLCSSSARSWLVNNLDRCPAYSAGLGVEHMNLLLPVCAGDVLRLEVRVLEARLSKSHAPTTASSPAKICCSTSAMNW
ncbi:MAG: hypothetical protein R3E63_04240 [Pseudomonadales bacterium]